MPQYRNLRNMMTVASFAGVLIGLVVVEFSIRNTGKYMTGSEIRGNGFISPWSPDLAEWSSPRIPGEYSAQQTEYFSYPPKKVNNAGFLDIPWKEKKDSTKRIMCLGDSYMEGFGASLDSSCPRILQALLPHTEVLNAGLTGRDIFSEYMLLKEYLLDVYHPDAVIVEIAILGLRSSAITSGGLERFNAAGQVISKKAPWYEPLYKNFHLVRFMALRWFSCDPETHLPMGVLPDEQQKAIEKMKVCMDEYVRLCEERNVFCLFCFRPSNSDFKTESIELQRLKLYAKQEHYPYIDLLRYFKEKGVPDVMSEYYWVQEGHHTPKGYACMADGIASYFINRPDENYFQAEN